MEKNDARNCLNCRSTEGFTMAPSPIRMELKGEVADNVELWQCPNCKNVELLYND